MALKYIILVSLFPVIISGCSSHDNRIVSSDIADNFADVLAYNFNMKTFTTVKISDVSNGFVKAKFKWPEISDNDWFSFIIGIKPQGSPKKDSYSAPLDYTIHGTFLVGEIIDGENLFYARRHFDTDDLTWCNWLSNDGLGLDGFIIEIKKDQIKEYFKPGNEYLIILDLSEFPKLPTSIWLHYNQKYKNENSEQEDSAN